MLARRLVLAILLTMGLAGCGTVTAFVDGPDEVPFRGWPIYGGVRYIFSGPGQVYGSEYWKLGLAAFLIIAVDSTISALCDTILLPVTVPWALLAE